MGGRPGPSSPETTAALKNRAYCHQKNLLIRISIDLAISRALMGKQNFYSDCYAPFFWLKSWACSTCAPIHTNSREFSPGLLNQGIKLLSLRLVVISLVSTRLYSDRSPRRNRSHFNRHYLLRTECCKNGQPRSRCLELMTFLSSVQFAHLSHRGETMRH
uniref:Uncharacterized protein n=1 Tax=Physcomitrium patens TaxID=3218 RepID=A0A2K1J863_PHYPA|nr:hypothetical protein PHYPA_020834 [Physcomitrium patens]